MVVCEKKARKKRAMRAKHVRITRSCLCGTSVSKTLFERQHHCLHCGLISPRDIVSANIVQYIQFGTIDPYLQTLIDGLQKEFWSNPGLSKRALFSSLDDFYTILKSLNLPNTLSMKLS